MGRFKTGDRVRDTSATSGTGTITLAGVSPTGYQTFASAGFVTGDTFKYLIVGQVGTTTSEWEVGLGTYNSTGPTLARTRIDASSAGIATACTFSGNTKDVIIIPDDAATIPKVTRLTADATNATATMANLTDLAQDLAAGISYSFILTLYGINSAAAEGLAADFNGGTATATDFRAAGGIFASGGTDVVGANITTALATAITFTTITGESGIMITGSILVNAAGTFIPRFAEAGAHVTGTVTLRKGSSLTTLASGN